MNCPNPEHPLILIGLTHLDTVLMRGFHPHPNPPPEGEGIFIELGKSYPDSGNLTA